jgi:hypothetical protein
MLAKHNYRIRRGFGGCFERPFEDSLGTPLTPEVKKYFIQWIVNGLPRL